MNIDWAIVLMTAALVFALALGLLFWLRPRVLGFHNKTLWDWLSLLLVPCILATASFGVGTFQSQLQFDRAQEEGVQQYIDRISALMLEPATRTDPATIDAVGRAHTAVVLRLTDRDRSGRVLTFLDELDLLQRFSVNLEGLDLTGANLKGIAFGAIEFEDARLAGADLEDAELRGADFEDADLSNADLKFADLRDADFTGARLTGANLDYADLRGADLRTARDIGTSQLGLACVDNATLLPAAFERSSLSPDACHALDDDDGETEDHDDDLDANQGGDNGAGD